MQCTKCGSLAQKDWNNCPDCGASLKRVPPSKGEKTLKQQQGAWADPLDRFFAFLVDSLVIGVVAKLIILALPLSVIEAERYNFDAQTLLKSGGLDLDLSYLDYFQDFQKLGPLAIFLTVMLVYHGILESWMYGSTIGKSFFSIVVTNEKGQGLSLPRSFVRSLFRIFSLATGVVTFLLVLIFDHPLHDFLPGAKVRKRRA
ncbi:MAG: RDD family protein [Bdellovibrionales bacterium]|nr:RDD family protein [Bdellovibrionales bacterium]